MVEAYEQKDGEGAELEGSLEKSCQAPGARFGRNYIVTKVLTKIYVRTDILMKILSKIGSGSNLLNSIARSAL